MFVNYFFPGEAIQLNRAVLAAARKLDDLANVHPLGLYKALLARFPDPGLQSKKKKSVEVEDDTLSETELLAHVCHYIRARGFYFSEEAIAIHPIDNSAS